MASRYTLVIGVGTLEPVKHLLKRTIPYVGPKAGVKELLLDMSKPFRPKKQLPEADSTCHTAHLASERRSSSSRAASGETVSASDDAPVASTRGTEALDTRVEAGRCA